MLDAKFCLRCGTPLEFKRIADRLRPVCPACHYVHYVNPVIAAGTLVDHDGAVLLVRRGVPPGVGAWGLPAGYGEVGESPEETAVRETREETGIEVVTDELIGVYAFENPLGPSGALILFSAQVIGGDLCAGDDAQDVDFFQPDALPEAIAFATHRRALREWARARAIRYGPASSREMPAVRDMALGSGIYTPESWRAYQATARHTLVARDGSVPVAFAALRHDELESSLCLHGMFVMPAYRRWGIGTRLLGAARDLGQALGARWLIAHVPADNPGLLMFIHAGLSVCGLVRQGDDTALVLAHALSAATAQLAASDLSLYSQGEG